MTVGDEEGAMRAACCGDSWTTEVYLPQGERMILADWYDDRGEELLAAANRWMVANHKRPVHSRPGGLFHWFLSDEKGYDPPSFLPRDVFYLLAVRASEDQREVEAALGLALRKAGRV